MFGLLKKKTRREMANAVAATRHVEIAAESLKVVRSTLSPKTFFGRCDDIAAAEEWIAGTTTFDDLDIQTVLQIEFIDRVIAAGRIGTLEASMADYEWRLTPDAMLYYVMKICE